MNDLCLRNRRRGRFTCGCLMRLRVLELSGNRDSLRVCAVCDMISTLASQLAIHTASKASRPCFLFPTPTLLRPRTTTSAFIAASRPPTRFAQPAILPNQGPNCQQPASEATAKTRGQRLTNRIVFHHAKRSMQSWSDESLVVARHGHADEAHGDCAGFGCEIRV